MHSPTRSRLAFCALVSLLSAVTAPAQGGDGRPVVRLAPPALAAKFDVLAATVQGLRLSADPRGTYSIPVVFGADLRVLELRRHDVRGPGFRLLVEDATGVHQLPTPPCVTYRGTLREEPGAAIVAKIENGKLTAVVYREAQVPGGEPDIWVVQPLSDVGANAGPSAHVVFRAVDTVALPFQCGNQLAAAPSQPLPQSGTDTTYVCDIAIEADVQFYQIYGSNVTTTQNDITAVMNQADFIYNRDCNVQFNVSTILVTTTSVYTTNDAGTLLGQFGSRWASVHAGISRDVAHLFTGRNLSGSTIGIAYLSGICSYSTGYGLSQSRFTSNFNSRVGLTCHEVGHNFSAQHCNGSSPCYIMCSALGGCSGNVTLFSPAVASGIAGFASTRSCLSVLATVPVLTGVSPNTVTVFKPRSVTLSGSGLSGATSYTIGSQSYTSGLNVLADDTAILSPPRGTSFGTTTVRVTTPLGTSNALPLTYTVTSPPALQASNSIPATGGTAQWEFGGQPSELWILVLDTTPTTSPFQGLDLLSNPAVLSMGLFPPPLGISQFSFPVPGGLGIQLVYSQILQADVTTLNGTGVSNIGLTVLL